MANLPRKHQKIFAKNALNNGQFGSLQSGSPFLSNDIETIQDLPAYENGWNDAVMSLEELPPIEEAQALQYKTDKQLAYILQKGIPEWGSLQDYYIGDITREVGGTKLYKSITDNNVGNALTDIANWELLIDLSLTQATESTAGIAEIATQAEAEAFTDDTKIITPLKLSNAIGQIAIFEDQRPSGTVGGTGTGGGVANDRIINTVVYNQITGASLSANAITLPAGTYEIDGWTMATGCGDHKAVLFNNTDVTNALIGSSVRAATDGTSDFSSAEALLSGVITIPSAKTFSLKSYVDSLNPLLNSLTFGTASGFAGLTEVYSRIKVKKIA